MKLAKRVMIISAVFCGVVALLLLLNFWNMKQSEPLESATIEALVERLKAEPNNDALKEEIRSFDLLARKAYFTSRWQVRTGTWLLLAGAVLMAVSLKVYTDLRARIEPPEELSIDLLKERANSQYWLSIGGGLILAFSLVAALLTQDFLKEYQEMGSMELTAEQEAGSSVEVVELFPSQDSSGPVASENELEAVVADGQEGGADMEDQRLAEQTDPPQERNVSGTAPVAASAPVAFNPDNFKKNQANFRGFMGHGVSYHTNIPEQWNAATGEQLRWKVATSKHGFNTPVIWGDQIFLSGADEEARIVACYNRHTGQLLWEKSVTGIPGSPASMPRVTDDTGLAAPTLAVDGNRVYAIFATGDVVAFDLQGTQVWGRNLGVPQNHYGHASSLMVWENKLIIQYDTNAGGRLLTLNTSDGETIWDVQRPVHISWSSPVLIEVDGKIQVVTTSDPYVMGNDLETGAEVWKVEAMMGEVGPSVAYDQGLVYATNEYARLVAVEPRPGAEFVWEDDEYLSEASSPVAHNGLFYTATSYGVLACYDSKTGEKQWELEFNDGFYSSPMIAEGKLYIIDMDGVCHIVKADRSGTIIAEPELGEGGYALPVFADGRIYIRGEMNLYCFGK